MLWDNIWLIYIHIYDYDLWVSLTILEQQIIMPLYEYYTWNHNRSKLLIGEIWVS